LISCHKQKETITSEPQNSSEEVIGEDVLTDRIKALNTSQWDELNDKDVTNRNFENIIWWDANRLIGFGYNKRILFYNGNFIVHDMNCGVVAYGRYVMDNDGDIVCSILNRHIIVEKTVVNDEYYNLFFDYYKLFLENDAVTFTVKHDPNLYEMQWRLTSDPGGEVYRAKDQYTKADMIYYNDGVELYKYDGGIKQCADRLNVREKPSLNAKIIRVMETGEHVGIEARTTTTEKIGNTEDYWYYVNYNADDYIAVFGYVFGAYLVDDGAAGVMWTPP
jgi:hypothetical protein